MEQEIVREEVLDAMGISRPVYEEVQLIVGHMPTVDELSTLLAMYESSGARMGLLSWLKGQFHASEYHDYLGQKQTDIHEPKVKECLEIARNLFPVSKEKPSVPPETRFTTGLELYMVGDVSTQFLDSEYARKFLHLSDCPMELGSDEEARDYWRMILSALMENEVLLCVEEVVAGGLFGTLLLTLYPLGFDILTCREIRLDAFLFGEEQGRFVVALEEARNDFFLQKLSEAGLNCCFLGRTTHGRVVVDGMDFGPMSDFCYGKFEYNIQ